jgi:hypothetical protein
MQLIKKGIIMLIDAVFDNGQIKFLQPLQFAHKYFRVQVNIPAEEIIAKGTTNNENQSDTMQTFEYLLGLLYSTIKDTTSDKSDKKLWYERRGE